MREFVQIACYFIFALMWNLLAGYGGMVSIGQQAFFGFGGYLMLILGNEAGVNPFVAIPVAALATVVDARGAPGWNIDESAYWVVLPVIAAWALWALWQVLSLERARDGK